MPFTLNRLDEQIHLTNNAIQKKFSLSAECHEAIPEEKMWYSGELDLYLKAKGYGNAFEKKIFPAMRDILIQDGFIIFFIIKENTKLLILNC